MSSPRSRKENSSQSGKIRTTEVFAVWHTIKHCLIGNTALPASTILWDSQMSSRSCRRLAPGAKIPLTSGDYFSLERLKIWPTIEYLVIFLIFFSLWMGSFLNSVLKLGLVFVPTDNAHIQLNFYLFYKSVFFNLVMEQTTNSLLLDGCNETTHSPLWASADWKEMKRHNKNKIPLEIQCCFHLNCSLMLPHQVPLQTSSVSLDWLLISFFFPLVYHSKSDGKAASTVLSTSFGDSPKQAVAHTILFGWDTKFRRGSIELVNLSE